MSSSAARAVPPPFECLRHADPAEADEARAQLSVKKKWHFIHKLRRRKSREGLHPADTLRHSVVHPEEQDFADTPGLGALAVDIDTDFALLQDLPEDRDVYRWAVLYENQRGAHLFSTAYYSPMSLLPFDPPAFTVPSTSGHVRKGQPTVSLEEYPLPDGTWRWVSREWMVDMRGDGQVQYDGFEYAWTFRSKRWRATVGPVSAGGLVRRRRWVRLMVHPARSVHVAETGLSRAASQSDLLKLPHTEAGATRPPSVVGTVADDAEDESAVWRGDDGDWARCCAVLKHLGRDGRRLDLWKRWLGLPLCSPSALKDVDLASKKELRKPEKARSFGLPSIHEHRVAASDSDGETSTDVESIVEVASSDAVAAVLRVHGPEVMRTFIYPESRAQFVGLLTASGLLDDLHVGLGSSDSRDFLEFCSYGA